MPVMKRPAGATQDTAVGLEVPVKVVKLSSKEQLEDVVPVVDNAPPRLEDDNDERDCFENEAEEVPESVLFVPAETPDAPDWPNEAWAAHGQQTLDKIVFNLAITCYLKPFINDYR